MEKRKKRRVPKRFNVRFGEQDLSHSGFTRDLSPDGAFVVSNLLPALGTRLHLQIVAGTTRCLYFEGVVRRHKLVPPQLRGVEHGGFGVALLAPGELFLELVPATEHAHLLQVHFPDAASLSSAWQKELRLGGLFVRTDVQLARDAEVAVSLHLDWLGQRLDFLAKVMQAVSVPGTKGLAVSFREPAAVRAAVASHVGIAETW
ncbi:MAG TPA: PilZ domain-containing protein [Myxococcales bacterium]|jgi:Tfp pilus assembly protein PilZ